MVVLKQLGAEPELVHCHDTLTLEALMSRKVTSVGVGGAGGDIMLQTTVNFEGSHDMYIPLAGRETILGALVLLI